MFTGFKKDKITVKDQGFGKAEITYSNQKPIGEGLDCGHYPQEEKPKEVINWLKNFYNV